ncbi:MAG TPA: hypothetical protein EYI82_04345 [Gammaproteobacteria bacterium]|nr:hypothetical protein [Gammaproteobacteria bacterium]
MKKIITAMSMAIVLTSSNAMAQEEFGLGSISDFFSEMRNSIEEGVTSASDSIEEGVTSASDSIEESLTSASDSINESTAEVQNIDFSLDAIKAAIFGEPEVVEKVIYKDKPVEVVKEKIVYQEKIVEKIIKVQPKERNCVTKIHKLAVPAGESTTITTCTEWK